MRLESLALPWSCHRVAEKRVESPFRDIEEIALKAGLIWFDNRGNNRERFKEAADNLLKHLTPAIVSNPDFYQKVDGKVHDWALELLGTVIPREDEKELAKFMEGPVHRMVIPYLREIIAHKVTMPLDPVESNPEPYKARIASRLRLRFPNRYLDLISQEIGLPVPPKRSEGF